MKLTSYFFNLNIRTKLFAAISILIAVISLFVYLYFPRQYEIQATEAIAAKANSITQMTAFSLSAALFFSDIQIIEEVFESTKQNKDLVYIILLDTSGKEIASFNNSQAHQANYLETKNKDLISPDGMIFRTVFPVFNNNQEIGQLYLGFSLMDIHKEIENVRKSIAIISIIILAGGMIALFSLSSLITRPLRQMTKTIEKISHGDLTQRTTVKNEDEVGNLAMSFNKMVDKLEKAQSELKDININLESKVEDRTKELQYEINVRIRAEKELQKSEKRYRTLFEGVPVGLYRTTQEGKVLDANPTLVKMLGYPDRKSLFEVNANDIYVDPKVRNRMHTIMDRAGVVYNSEQRMRRYDGKIIWSQDTARAVLDGEGQTLYYEGSLQDITERKNAEQNLLEAKKKAELALIELKEYQSIMIHKERLAALGELSAGIAHEINNPLSIVSGYVQMLLMDDNVDIRIKENAKIIEQQVRRASLIVDKLLQFSKGAKSEITKVDVNQIVENILVLLKHQFKLFNITVVKQLDLKLDPINADPSQLQHVFHNIISNAVDAMPKGGTLTVSTGLKDGYVEVRFADTGWGIPKKNQGRLFDPFFTTKEAGTGLGLSLSFGIVEAHKGQIVVKSSINKGATFILKLPR